MGRGMFVSPHPDLCGTTVVSAKPRPALPILLVSVGSQKESLLQMALLATAEW
jgi:hypothetical protein